MRSAIRIPYSVAKPGIDPRDPPVYSLSEASAFLDIPIGTIRWWAIGRLAGPHGKWIPPLIEKPDGTEDLLSFNNLGGQLGLKPILDLYLERLVRDEAFLPTKIFPVMGGQKAKVVSIAQGISSGRPILDAYGIPVSSLWNRFKAGDTILTLAEDYEIPRREIVGALAYVEHYSVA